MLPAPLTAFIGRERALVDVGTAVREHRLVTLVGTGGAGKTRLSIEIARRAVDAFDDGVVWIELAPLTDGALVAQTVAAALGLRHQPGRALADSVAEYLSTRSVLLVLDNCEHVIDAVVELLTVLLAEAPRVHILTTSRERLSLTGERSWPVGPLELPPKRSRDLNTLLNAEAVRLFIDRAAAVKPAFATDAAAVAAIVEICTRVDGIPLAIELAAARMNVLTPRQIADRLAGSMSLLTTGPRTLPRRQRTLRATIDWSYRLLEEQERLLFRRLSVFAGTFSLDAAEAVCGDATFPECDVLDTLAGLADKSLIAVRERAGEARYRMLETVDQFATELLDEEADAEATRRRHAEYYCGLIEAQAPLLYGATRARALQLLDAEHDNIRAALDWTREAPGCAALHQRMISLLWWYWLHRVFWDEAMQRFSAAVGMADAEIDPVVYAQTLYGGGVLAWVSGMFLQSRTWLERCVDLRRTQGDAGALGMALCSLAHSTFDLGDRAAALELARQGLPLVREGCSSWDLALVLTSAYGYVHHAGGFYDEAERAYLEADALWLEHGDEWGRSLALNSLAVVAWRRGDIARAESYARTSLELLRGVGDRWFASRTLLVLGYIAERQTQFEHAVRLLGASDALRSEVGARLMPFEVPEWNRTVDTLRAQLGEHAFGTAWDDGCALDFDAAIAFALGPVTASPSEPAPARSATAAEAAAEPADPEVRAQRAQQRVEPASIPREDDAALAIRAFGPLQVRRDGRLLTNEDWTYARPRELLFYLLSNREGRTRDQIGLDLWPEASPAQLRSSFHVTMHHLRRALGGAEWITFHENRYRFEAARTVAYDVDTFTAIAQDASRAAPGAERTALLERAVGLYRGEFLEGAGFGDWTHAPRERLRRAYADAALQLAATYREAGSLQRAEAVCRELLGRDNLDERAHRLLMQILADAGRPAEALRHLNVLTALLREELSIMPSPETLALADTLRN
jgi:predicted ATPase/DNA-binding SARP family transcriptional activator